MYCWPTRGWAAFELGARCALRRRRRCAGSWTGSWPGINGRRRPGAATTYDAVTDLVAEKVVKSAGRISAKRLLPVARTAGYAGSA
jgi:hypothetical protein